MKLKSYQRIVELNLDGTKRKYVKIKLLAVLFFLKYFLILKKSEKKLKTEQTLRNLRKKSKKCIVVLPKDWI